MFHWEVFGPPFLLLLNKSMEEEFEEPLFVMNLDMKDIKLLYKSVCHYLEHWPGYPKCPIEEQNELIEMKAYLYRAILEDMYNK